jgi:hypothetical protein
VVLAGADVGQVWRTFCLAKFQIVSVVVCTLCFCFTWAATFCFNSSSLDAFPCHLQAWSASLQRNS